jgi:hypothetical protein
MRKKTSSAIKRTPIETIGKSPYQTPWLMKWFAGSTPSFHPGRIRMRDTLQARYHNCRLRSAIDQLHCQDCQRHKLAGKDYGLLPECEVRVAPWEEVAIDLIGPWKNKFGIKLVEFNALTCIDTASNLVELVRIDNKTSNHIRDKFSQTWLCLYHRPICCVHDKGGEFIGSEFQWLLDPFSVKDISAPGALASSRNMFLNVPLIADWRAIARACEHHVNENLQHANRKRQQYDYAVGQRVLKKVHDQTKFLTLSVYTSMATLPFYCVPVLPNALTYSVSCRIVKTSISPKRRPARCACILRFFVAFTSRYLFSISSFSLR